MSDLKNETSSMEFEEYKKALVELAEAINRLSVSNVDKLMTVHSASKYLTEMLLKMGVKNIDINTSDEDYENAMGNDLCFAGPRDEDPHLYNDIDR
jgi:hypothetical protein